MVIRKSYRIILLLFFVALTLLYLEIGPGRRARTAYVPPLLKNEAEVDVEKPAAVTRSHPIEQLFRKNEAEFAELVKRQSKTLEEAVKEYRRRYGLPPPPHFDIWFRFAQDRNVVLIDEYDTIHKQLTPFWAISPATIRARTREALGYDNALIALSVRSGKITLNEGGGDGYEWQRKAFPLMLARFLKYLPDMDLAFNIHDEPRVVMQHDDLSRHVGIASTRVFPKLLDQRNLRNSFSYRPSDMNNGDRLQSFSTTRFNRYAHQPTWVDSKVSCHPDSAARRSLDDSRTDDTSLYTQDSPLGFLVNTTAFSDICNSPSLSSSFGFFDRPNAFNIAHDLFPIFSQSKVSSFQDILYPSPWYFVERVKLDTRLHDAVPWESRKGTLFWRGSTTGGFSRDGGWRNQHRQRFVQKTMPVGTTSLLKYHTERDIWEEQKNVSRADIQDLFDVHFTGIGQCDPGDCDAQRDYFDLRPGIDMFDALNSKYLLDIDGNAFSGRYYSFLQSKSLVYKMSLFREWHDEWLFPWVHYLPLSIQGEEYAESVRYMEEEEQGKRIAKHMAEASSEWAFSVLRKEDMEVWFFRLLLEYGRLVDDGREEIGFALETSR